MSNCCFQILNLIISIISSIVGIGTLVATIFIYRKTKDISNKDKQKDTIRYVQENVVHAQILMKEVENIASRYMVDSTSKNHESFNKLKSELMEINMRLDGELKCNNHLNQTQQKHLNIIHNEISRFIIKSNLGRSLWFGGEETPQKLVSSHLADFNSSIN